MNEIALAALALIWWRLGRAGETSGQAQQLSASVEQLEFQLQQSNAAKLDEMRATVDEKLHRTLEPRLSESFAHVAQRLEQVYKGLGEMQALWPPGSVTSSIC